MYFTMKISNLSITKDLKKLNKKVRKNVIEKGLDKPLYQSLQQLKKDLQYIVTNRVKDPDTKQTRDILGNEKILLSKSDEIIAKEIFNIDIPKINKTKDYSTIIQDNAIIIRDDRVRLRVPIGPDTTFEEAYTQAQTFFKNAIFIHTVGNETFYIKNPGVDLSQYLKIVCSTDVGDTSRSRRKFDHYKNSDLMTKPANSEVGRFAEWSLKQEFVKKMLNPNSGMLNMSEMVKKLKEGDFESAHILAKQIKDNDIQERAVSKISEIEDRKATDPTTSSYFNIISLINNLKFRKKIKKEVVTYELISKFTISDKKQIAETEIFEIIKKELDLWLIINSDKWFKELVALVQQTLQELNKA